MAIKALLFDFGNVISFFDYVLVYQRLSALSQEQHTPAAVEKYLIDGGILNRFESGKISEKDFITDLQDTFGLDGVEREEIVKSWAEIFRPNLEVISIIKKISDDVRLVLTSNTNGIHYAYFSQQFADVLQRFDEFVLSYEVGYMKPHRQFFEAALHAAKCTPKECVFIDDVTEYVEAARGLGINAIHYTPETDLKVELATFGVNV